MKDMGFCKNTQLINWQLTYNSHFPSTIFTIKKGLLQDFVFLQIVFQEQNLIQTPTNSKV